MKGNESMRKFGSSKRNPNPPWPCVQQGVVLPPGSNALEVSRNHENIKEIQNIETKGGNSDFSRPNRSVEPFQDRDGFMPIMGYMNEAEFYKTKPDSLQTRGCANINVSDYLCDKVGNYARVEFLFGENSHIEKTGIIESVGKDFLVLAEAGTGSRIVCSSKNIKFINIYNLK